MDSKGVPICAALIALCPALVAFAPRPGAPAAVIALPFAPEGGAVRAAIAGDGRLLSVRSNGRLAIALFEKPRLWLEGSIVLRVVGSECGGEDAAQ